MYNSDQTFGGISVLLIGDFIQLPVTTGHDLWSVMYGTVSGNDGTARELFQQFCAKELTINIQSSECVCVSWPPVMRGVTVTRAIPIASNPPR